MGGLCVLHFPIAHIHALNYHKDTDINSRRPITSGGEYASISEDHCRGTDAPNPVLTVDEHAATWQDNSTAQG
jgi:hypothetical protein